MFCRIFTVLLLITITSCVPPADRFDLMDLRAKMNQTHRTHGTLSEADCKLHKGIWRGAKNAESAVCDEIPLDAGKICSDNYDCEAFCSTKSLVIPGIRATGTCFHTFDTKGCRQGISSSIADTPTCN